MEIDLSKQELKDGQLLVVYIMLRTFDDIDLYKIVLFYMVLEAYIYEQGEDKINFEIQTVLDYLGLSLEDFENDLKKLIEYGWLNKDEEGLVSVNYEMIFKLNQEIVSEEKKPIDSDFDVREILAKNRQNGVKMKLDRYWE